MKFFRHFVVTAALLLVSSAQLLAQLDVKIKSVRKEYMQGENVVMRVQISNMSGRELTLHDQPNVPWVDIQLLDAQGEMIGQSKFPRFGALKLGPNQSVGREITLNNYYDIKTAGMMRCKIFMHIPGDKIAYPSNTEFFDVTAGFPLWSINVGNPRNAEQIRYSVVHANSPGNKNLYVRISAVEADRIYHCIPFGKWISYCKPLCVTDNNNSLHVLYLATPESYVHMSVTADGVRSKPRFFRRVEGSTPSMLKDPKGQVQVVNALEFDPYKQQQSGDIDLNERPQ